MRKLTSKELQVMEAFWDSEEPLTSVDLFKSHEADGWSRNFVQNAVARLARKEFIEHCGMARCNTQYARMFKPRITREEYSTVLMADLNVSPDKLTDIVIHFARKDKRVSKSKLIGQLKEALNALRRTDS